MNRTERILGQIRLSSKEFGIGKVEDEVILDTLNLVQNDILLKTECIEKEFNIRLKSGVQSYNFANKNFAVIKNILSPFDDEIEIQPNNLWNTITSGLETGEPAYCTIFGNKIHFYPTPTSDNDIVKIWACQSNTVVLMDKEVNPEVPEYCDNALIFGTLARLGLPEYFQSYEQQLSFIKGETIKYIRPKQVQGRW